MKMSEEKQVKKKETKEREDKFKKAGKIANQIKESLSEIVTPGTTLLEVAEWLESKIRENGAEPAFPPNICVGNIAAHYTPEEGKQKIPEDEIIKIDFGANIDGFSSDTAVSFYFGEEQQKKQLINVAKEALERGLTQIEDRANLTKFGETVESYVEEQGFNVVENLTGHLIERYKLHGEKDIPVTSGAERVKAETGEVYGVEVFVTNGQGFARSSEEVRIYSLASDLPERIRLRLKDARKVLYFLRQNRHELPFTPRWLYPELGRDTTKIGVSLLKRRGALVSYPVLREQEEVTVAQAECTVLVTEEGVDVLT